MSPSLLAPLAAAALAASAGAMALSAEADLTRDAGFRVLAPADGARVGPAFLLRWAGDATARYAVVVDAAVPSPGSVVAAGHHVVLVTGTAVRLTLGPRTKGSPSVRDHHEVVVVPLDGAGRRDGEAAAVVRVRA